MGAALAVIIPEGVRALYSERVQHVITATKDYTVQPIPEEDGLHSVIGISLVLGLKI